MFATVKLPSCVFFPIRMDQVKLWVPLLMIILVLAIFIWWCRSDESCCDVEKPCLYRFGCKKHKDDEEEE